MTSRRAPALILNLLVLAAFVAALEYYWGWGRLLTPWRQIAPATLLLALAGMLASFALRALRIYLAESQIPRGAYLTCLRLILLNISLNLLLPARSGEASFPILMRRWFGIDAARATGTLIWLRLLDLQVLATVGAVCAAGGWLGGSERTSLLVWLGAALIAMAPLLLFALRRPLAAKLVGRTGRLTALATRALGGLPERGRMVALDLTLTWSAWTLKLAALGIVLARLAEIRPILGVLGAIGGDLSTVLPVHAPGGFGTYEAGVMALLAPALTPSGALLAAAVNLHLLVLTVALLCGALAWLAGLAQTPVGQRPDARL